MKDLPPLAYTCDYTVQMYDIDSRHRMTVAALVRLMQEASMQNVMQMKVSAWDMEAMSLSWVLLRKQLTIKRLPVNGEQISVVTYSCGFEKFFTYRDYKVFDKNQELIAWSSSAWLLMDTKERRMARIPDFVLAFESQMPPEEECLPRPKTKLPKFENAETSRTFRVNWHDLDFNGHLNNVFYFQWMLEALPDHILQHGTLRDFDILYKVEAHWKDELISEIQQLDEMNFLHRLIRIEDGKEVAQGMSRFEL
jgi:medium-chain acyl-[acyl-carrier-protein] hydrolase